MADIHTSNHLDTPIEQEAKNKANKSSNLQSKIKTLTAAGLLALSLNTASANEDSFTTYTGEVMTFATLKSIMYDANGEYTERGGTILDNMTDADYERYDTWKKMKNQEEITQSKERQAQSKERQAQSKERQARIEVAINNENEIQANSRKKQAEYQASIDRENKIQASNRAETKKLRANTQINRQINALMLVVSGKKGILSNQEMSQALESIANDTKLQLTQQEKNIYLQLAESYKNGGNGPLVVSKKAKNAIRGVAQQILVSDMSSYATAQEEKKIKKDLNTFLQHM